MNSVAEQQADHQTGRPALGSAARPGVVCLCLCMLLSSVGTSIPNVALPTFSRVFEATFQQVQWIVLAYLLAITTLIVSIGKIGDVVGRRRLLLVGTTILTVSSLLCGCSPSLWYLVAARAIQGGGAAVMMALTLAFVAETVPKARIGSAMGLLGTMSAIGTALGPSLGGFLIAGFGWRSIFLFNVPLGVTALLLGWRYLPADRQLRHTERIRFDTTGTLLLALTLAAYTLSLTLGRGHFGTFNAVLLLVSGAGIALFALAETRSPAPLIRLNMLRDPALFSGLSMSLLVSAVLMTTLVVGPFYLSLALRLTTVQVGLIMSVGPIVAALSGVPAGRIVDRSGTQAATRLGLSGIALGCLALSLMPVASGISGYVFPIIVVTSSYALFQTANNTAVMKEVHEAQRGVVSGMLNLSRNLGLITGTSLMGAIFASGVGTRDIPLALPDAVAKGMRVTFGFAVVMIVIALAIELICAAAVKRQLHNASLK